MYERGLARLSFDTSDTLKPDFEQLFTLADIDIDIDIDIARGPGPG